jgi:hypothetical protein
VKAGLNKDIQDCKINFLIFKYDLKCQVEVDKINNSLKILTAENTAIPNELATLKRRLQCIQLPESEIQQLLRIRNSGSIDAANNSQTHG